MAVVITIDVDHQAAQHTFNSLRHLGLERFEFVIALDELGNVVVGVESATRCVDPLANHL